MVIFHIGTINQLGCPIINAKKDPFLVWDPMRVCVCVGPSKKRILSCVGLQWGGGTQKDTITSQNGRGRGRDPCCLLKDLLRFGSEFYVGPTLDFRLGPLNSHDIVSLYNKRILTYIGPICRRLHSIGSGKTLDMIGPSGS